MSEHQKYAIKEETDTADDFYPDPNTKPTQSTIPFLQMTLTSKINQLRSIQIQQQSLKDQIQEQDLKAQKLQVVNECLMNDGDGLQKKHESWLKCKKEALRDLNQWKKTVNSMEQQVKEGRQNEKLLRKCIADLKKGEEEKKMQLKIVSEEKEDVFKYKGQLQLIIEKQDNQISKKKCIRDDLARRLVMLETFAKSFKKNIMMKEKEITKEKSQGEEILNQMKRKEWEICNLQKEKERNDWESKMYDHHNQEIKNTNERLRDDFAKLQKHLGGLGKSNQQLKTSLKQFGETGVEAAKKLLQQVNR